MNVQNVKVLIGGNRDVIFADAVSPTGTLLPIKADVKCGSAGYYVLNCLEVREYECIDRGSVGTKYLYFNGYSFVENPMPDQRGELWDLTPED